MSWSGKAADYFKFGKRDRVGIFGLLAIIIIIYLLPKFASSNINDAAISPDTSVLRLIDTLQKNQTVYEQQNHSSDDQVDVFQRSQGNDYPKGALFIFDPNNLSADGWHKLGLSERTAATIKKYTSKGGKFYKPEDLKKIWGLPKGFYERVAPYIRLETVSVNTPYTPVYAPPQTYERKERKTIAIVDVNSADTAAFIALPGIGAKLAFRITNFRDKLGGFYSVDQIKETYGLPDSTFQKIKPYLNVNVDAVRKQNINIATKDELKMHPYIKWNIANAIVEYRNQHGAFKSLTELKNIVLVDESLFQKISPYFILQ